MPHKSLILALMMLCSFSIVHSAAQEQTASTGNTNKADNLGPDSDGVYSSPAYCNPDNSSWDEKDSTSASFGYFSIGVGYTHLTSKIQDTSYSNTQPQYLGNPVTPIENPNYGTGMLLETDKKSLSSGAPMGSFEFGYNAAFGQTKAFIGFFAGLKISNASSTIPVLLTEVDYGTEFDGTEFSIIDPQTVSTQYQSDISSRLALNAGVLCGYKFNERLFGFVKLGWSCLRTTSSKTDQSSIGKNPVSSGYSPIYVNGLMYGGGLDFALTERLSVGIEAFGTSYSDRKITLLAYQSNPGTQTQNNTDTGEIGMSPSIQKLSADPMKTSMFGVMLTLKINFLER